MFMTERSVSLILVIVTGAMLALIFTMSNHDVSGPSRIDQLSVDINGLSPSAAGMPSSSESTPPVAQKPGDGYIGGTKATGRVAGVYLKVNQGVFLALDRAPETLRKTAERYVDVQFPDLLANGSGAARAFLGDAQSGVTVGDIVEIKFAHKSGKETASYFPVKELTRVTEVVAKRDEMLARDYEQRILARTIPGTTRQTQFGSNVPAVPGWLAPQGGAPSASPMQAPVGQTAALPR
jgi:hypothetical protein